MNKLNEANKQERKGVVFSLIWIVLILIAAVTLEPIITILMALPLIIGWGMHWVKQGK